MASKGGNWNFHFHLNIPWKRLNVYLIRTCANIVIEKKRPRLMGLPGRSMMELLQWAELTGWHRQCSTASIATKLGLRGCTKSPFRQATDKNEPSLKGWGELIRRIFAFKLKIVHFFVFKRDSLPWEPFWPLLLSKSQLNKVMFRRLHSQR